ncbi:Mor transcription activator family protein [Dehalobacter sp. 4CP]|uniref:Mor transcription activator family protein n=1 Tax=Dehalobacter sp. CP TaxID=2594474 RepID=UPI0039EC968A
MSNVVPIKKLKEVVGEVAFDELVKQLPGTNVYIPKNFNEEYHDRKKRNKYIRADYIAGMEIPDLMEKYSLSKATIYKIIENR